VDIDEHSMMDISDMLREIGVFLDKHAVTSGWKGGSVAVVQTLGKIQDWEQVAIVALPG
jgi:hypothetical protein